MNISVQNIIIISVSLVGSSRNQRAIDRAKRERQFAKRANIEWFTTENKKNSSKITLRIPCTIHWHTQKYLHTSSRLSHRTHTCAVRSVRTRGNCQARQNRIRRYTDSTAQSTVRPIGPRVRELAPLSVCPFFAVFVFGSIKMDVI